MPVLALWVSGIFGCPILVYSCPGPQNSDVVQALVTLGEVSYGAVILGSIMCLFVREVRFIGYGLLTMVFVAPVVGVIGCSVIASNVHA
jgi:hypothetical protein